MRRREFLGYLAAGTAALALPRGLLAADGGPRRRPNIVLIMSDDMGYSDLGCYGGEIQTPNLDGLAARGLRFTQFYNTARCCPTRASLLTGLYPHQAAVGHMTEDKGLEGYQGDLSHRAVTIAEVLRPAGYATYMVGKWHVTRYSTDKGPKDNWPLGRGFDRFYGTIQGAGSYFDPGTLTRDSTMISPFADPQYKAERFYTTDAIRSTRCGSSRNTPGRRRTSRSSCTQPTRPRTGRCTPSRRTSPGTRASTMAATRLSGRTGSSA